MKIILHRVYDHAGPEPEGMRILVDRIWPRGVARAAANWDEWLKEVAPSTELRSWFAHDREKWEEFQQRYFAELATAGPARDAVDALKKIVSAHDAVVFMYAAKDQICNNAVALKTYMEALPGWGQAFSKD